MHMRVLCLLLVANISLQQLSAHFVMPCVVKHTANKVKTAGSGCARFTYTDAGGALGMHAIMSPVDRQQAEEQREGVPA